MEIRGSHIELANSHHHHEWKQMFKITSLLFSLHSPWFLSSLQNENSNQLRSVQVPLPSSSRLARPFSLAMQIFTSPAKVLFIIFSRYPLSISIFARRSLY